MRTRGELDETGRDLGERVVTEIGLAAGERRQLCELMDQLGPDAPTLCAGWTTRDLAAHLVIREGRPDAAVGILVPPLAWYTTRVQAGAAAQPWAELVERVRTGPPRWSLLRLSPVGDRVNGVEFFVHHEDVRRAQPGWTPRAADPHRSVALWETLTRLGRLCYRKSPVGVVLRGPDGLARTIRRGARTVTVTGPPEELLLHAYGRAEALVDLTGDPADVAALQASDRGF